MEGYVCMYVCMLGTSRTWVETHEGLRISQETDKWSFKLQPVDCVLSDQRVLEICCQYLELFTIAH